MLLLLYLLSAKSISLDIVLVLVTLNILGNILVVLVIVFSWVILI